MTTLSNFLSGAVEKLLFQSMTITHAETFAGCFRKVRLQGAIFQDANWVPRQAVEFYLGNLTKRAYTPMVMEPDLGTAEFLFYLHGAGPGSAWAANVKPGDECRVMRPKNSLDFTDLKGNAVFFGDETSIAAAYALQSCARAGAISHLVFEVTSEADTKSVVDNLGLRNVTLYQRTNDSEHLESVIRKLVHSASDPLDGTEKYEHADRSARQLSQWIFTGQARSIQTVQRRLRQLGVELRKSKVRAYWSPGKTGMD